MKRAKPIVLCVVLINLFELGLGYACTCMAPPTIEEAFGKSSAVFIGKVTEIYRPLLDRVGVLVKHFQNKNTDT